MCRIIRLYNLYVEALERALKKLDIKQTEWAVLVTVRRKGKDEGIPIKVILQEVLLTSGAMTNLVHRLIKADYLEKRKDEQDKREVRVSLTAKGVDLVDRAMEIQAGVERRFVESLDRSERTQLEKLLKKMVLDVDYY
ncbi:MAG: winged helix DNA-binding protein, partial [Chlamydiia bacterium]|nr:winged helix DNA-binding protein [Chlamydiia bacterium]